MTIDDGIILEYRIKKLLFHLGYFSRNHLTLRSYFYPEVIDVTDIDALGVKFSSNFNCEMVICECKTGDSDGTVDRILWLAGLSGYFSTTSAMIVKKSIPSKIKRFAQEVGITPIDYARLKEIEKTNGRPDVFLGSNDYEYYEPKLREYYQFLKDDAHLAKIYWFLRSQYWYSQNSTRMKKTLTALKMLSANPKFKAGQWLTYEATTLFSLSLVYLCKELFPLSDKERPEYINNLLITGLVSPDYSRKILGAAYGLIASKSLGNRTGGQNRGLSKIKRPTPDYAPALIDLIERMVQRPSISAEVPRFMDFLFFEYLFKQKAIDEKIVRELFPFDTQYIAKMSKNVVKFIIETSNISEELFKSLNDF